MIGAKLARYEIRCTRPKVMAVTVAPQETAVEIGAPVALFPVPLLFGSSSGFLQQYDVTRDGRLLIATAADEADNSPIVLLLNWKSPVK